MRTGTGAVSLVVGISGKIGVGKDEIAKRLVAAWGFTVSRFSEDLKLEVLRVFSKTVRAIAAEFWGKPTDRVTPAEMRDLVYNRKPPIIRALLQEHGTELRRAEDADYWLKRWHARVDGLLTDGVRRIVAPDVRFANEAQAILAMGGSLVNVSRPGHWEDGHASEAGLPADLPLLASIENGGSLEALHLVTDAVAKALIGARDDG